MSSDDSGTARVSAPPSPSLDRRLGPFDAAALVVSNVIGGGCLSAADRAAAGNSAGRFPQDARRPGAIGALALVHVRGLRLGRVVQNGLTALKVASLALFVSLGFSIGHSVPAQLAAPGTTGIALMLLALIPIMFAYSGWKAGAYVAEETRSPERNVPLALGLGTLAVIVIYLDPWTSTAGLAVIAAGMPMYWWMRAGQSVRP